MKWLYVLCRLRMFQRRKLVPVLRPLMKEWGTVTAYSPSNSLIIVGDASNYKTISAYCAENGFEQCEFYWSGPA